MAAHTSKIKLFVDAHSFGKGYQGTQTFIRELYTELIATQPQLDVHFGTSNPENVMRAFPSLSPQNILPYKQRKAGFLRLHRDIPAYLKAHNFDFAHFQYISPKPVDGCRYIVTLHDIIFNDFPSEFSWLYRKSREYLFGQSIRKADIKTTVSIYSKNRICERYNIPSELLHVIPNGVKVNREKALAHKEASVKIIQGKYAIQDFILCVSRIEPRKNHELLLDAYLELRLYERNIALVFIGKETLHIASLQNKINRLTEQQQKLFFWREDISEADLYSFYSACKLFVYPSKAEGFGIPPLEAGACGAPVLCSSATAMQQFDFFKPYVFNPADKEELKSKMLSLLNSPPSAAFLKDVSGKIYAGYQWTESSRLFYNLLMQ